MGWVQGARPGLCVGVSWCTSENERSWGLRCSSWCGSARCAAGAGLRPGPEILQQATGTAGIPLSWDPTLLAPPRASAARLCQLETTPGGVGRGEGRCTKRGAWERPVRGRVVQLELLGLWARPGGQQTARAAGLEERGTGKAWWVEQCVNHGPRPGTANPSSVPRHAARLPSPCRDGWGAPGGLGRKGKAAGSPGGLCVWLGTVAFLVAPPQVPGSRSLWWLIP